MWLFTSTAAVSVVEDWKDSSKVWVRARVKGHVEAFVRSHPSKKFPRAKHTPKNDYAYRLQISKVDLKEIVLEQVDRIDYTNFKDSVTDTIYHGACSKVWNAFLDHCNTGCYAMKSLLKRKTIPDEADYFRGMHYVD